MRLLALGLVALMGGCASFVPVETPKLAVPKECSARHYADLPKVDELPGPQVSPDQVNKHWAKEYRMKQRQAYRRLYRNYRVCARYARGS
jgi:hypothetical protein